MAASSSRETKNSWVVYQGNNAGIAYSGDYVSRYETLIGYRGPRITNSIHPVTHKKVSVALHKALLVVPNKSSKLEGLIPVSAQGATDLRCLVVTSSLSYSCSDVEARAALAELCGDVPPVVSVPNMILELPQTLSLWRQLKNPLLRALNLASKQTVKQRLKHGSNALLAQQFGLLPLAGDIAKLLTGTRSIHSEIARITARPKTWTAASKGLPSHSASLAFSMGHGAFGSYSVSESTQNVTARLHYQTRSSRTLPEGRELASAVAQALYGFDNPLEVLWEATPFSFVADWFFPIGDYLNSLDQSSFGGSMEVRRLCTCVKAQQNVTIDCSWSKSPKKTIASVYVTHFNRYLGLPTRTVSLGDVTVPGITQSILGGAIALQRMK